MATKTKQVNKPATTAARQPAPSRPASTAVAPRRSTEVSNLDYGQVGRDAGMEGADRDSFAIPFLQILQKMSPQLDRNHTSYCKGAKEGDIFNSANQEVYDGEEGILVAPVNFKRSFTAWTIREKGGGFKGEYVPSDPIIMTTVPDTKGRNMLPDGVTQLADTRLHAVVLLNGDTPQPALINMASTQIKKSKRWMSAMQEVQRKDNLPTFAHCYKLTTVPESNDKGSWMGWAVTAEGPLAEQEHVDAAVSFYKALQQGSLKMKADPNAEHSEE